MAPADNTMPAARKADAALQRDPPLFQLMTEVGIVAQLSQNSASRRLAPELNMPQFIVLNHFVRLDEEASLSRLARAMGVAKGAMTYTMARLEHKGYISIRPDPDDGRGKLAMITPAGRAARKRAVARLGQALASLAATLPDADLEVALRLLRDVGTWFDQNR